MSACSQAEGGSMRWARTVGWLALAMSFALGPAAHNAHAAGLSIGWLNCRALGGAGVDNQLFGCSSEINDLPLQAAFVLSSPVDSVIAFELVIDVDVADVSLPPWWRMDPGQCRAGGWSADVLAPASCDDPWQGAGVAAVQGWLAGTPGGSPRHGRLLVAAAAIPGTFVTLDADVAYTAARAVLRTNKTLTCEGCAIPACLVFNSLLIRRLPGSSVETLTLSNPEVPGLERVRWQGGSGADCQAVPTRRSTWGAVKSLYR